MRVHCKREGSFLLDLKAPAYFPTLRTLVSSFIVVEVVTRNVGTEVIVDYPVAGSTTWAFEFDQPSWRCQSSPPLRMNESNYEYTIPVLRGGMFALR